MKSSMDWRMVSLQAPTCFNPIHHNKEKPMLDLPAAQPLFSLADLQQEPIAGWDEFLAHGNGFLNTAMGAFDKGRQSFTPEILYNLAAMAIEKFVMAALMKQGALPYNHTMTDLVEALDETFPGAASDLKEGLLAMDRYQQICSFDTFHIETPTPDDIPAMLELAEGVCRLACEKIGL